MQPPPEIVPSRISSGSGIRGSSRRCSTGSQNQSRHVGGAEDNAEPTTLDQSILASAISSGMPTFLLTKGVSNVFLTVVQSDSRDEGAHTVRQLLVRELYCSILYIALKHSRDNSSRLQYYICTYKDYISYILIHT